MKKFYFSFSYTLIWLFLYIFNIKNFLIFSYVTIPFYYENKNRINTNIQILTPKEYYEQMLNLSTYTNIKVNNKYIKFHLTLDRHTTYISENIFNQIQENSNNNEQNLYSLDYIGISLASFGKGNFHLFVNGTKEQEFYNYSLFSVKNIKNNTKEYDIIRHGYATENNEIGLNIIKGSKYDNVEVGGYEPYLDSEFTSVNTISYNNNLRKLDSKYIIKNSGYNIEDKTNIINQLKSNDLITSYAFTVKFDKNNELNGSLIIGEYPHELEPKKYQEKHFIYDTVELKLSYYYWHYEFKDIFIGEKKSEWVKEAEISFEFPFILSTYNYWKYLDKSFFKNINYSDFCYEEKVEQYFIKYCSKQAISKFPTLYFHLSNTYLTENQTNYIEFNYEDLFVKSSFDDNIYLCQMIFVDNSYKWILGKLLFKKYTTVFNQDKKTIGFYTESKEYNDTDNETTDETKDDINKKDENKNNNNFKNWFYLVIIFACIFLVLSIVLTVLFCKKYPFGKRKIKANELDDDYEYNTKNQNEKNEVNQEDLLIND